MPEIAIVTDTDCSLPLELSERYGIRQVPITIHFGEDMYTSGKDIDDRMLFENIRKRGRMPTTSAPPPAAFAAAFEAALASGAKSVICICVSSKVSATYTSAVNAAGMFAERDITVVDSLNLTMGQGFMVLAAAEAAARGAGKAEILAAVASTGQRLHTYAVLATLKYLAMSGRVGKITAGMADTLNIKPILTVSDGKLDMLERIRTRKKAMERLIDLVRTAAGDRPIDRAAIIHINNRAEANDLHDQLCSAMPFPREVITTEFTPGLSVHAGEGVVGVVFQTR